MTSPNGTVINLRSEQPLLRSARSALIALAECLNSEARGIRHLRSRQAFDLGRQVCERIDKAPAHPLLAEAKEALVLTAGCLERESHAEHDPKTQGAVLAVVVVVQKIERALDAYRKG